MFYAIYMATRPRGFALVLVPVYFIKHSVSCIYLLHTGTIGVILHVRLNVLARVRGLSVVERPESGRACTATGGCL